MSSASTVALLKPEEGWRARPYLDTAGIWTVGWGFVVDPAQPWELPREVGDFWLAWLEKDRRQQLAARWSAFARQPEDVQDALVCMAFQMGVHGVLAFDLMLAALERGDRETAAVNALDSAWHRNPKTRARAERVADLIRGHKAEGDD